MAQSEKLSAALKCLQLASKLRLQMWLLSRAEIKKKTEKKENYINRNLKFNKMFR